MQSEMRKRKEHGLKKGQAIIGLGELGCCMDWTEREGHCVGVRILMTG